MPAVDHPSSPAPDGPGGTVEELFPLVYEELRRLAARKTMAEDPNQTLQATALVHEAWMRLAGEQNARFANRAHFLAVAAEAMRRILVDRARRRKSAKRGGGATEIDLDQVDVAERADDETLLRIDDALQKLAREDARAAELTRLRFIVGLTNEEAALALGLSERSAKRYWTFARAWLYRENSCDPTG